MLNSVPYSGDEKSSKAVEILCGGDKLWEVSTLIKDRHLSAGTYENGENSYICQGIDNKNKLLGTFRESTSNCCYPYYGKQVCTLQYSLLVNDC